MPESRIQSPAALSIILPTYNEAANLPELLERISIVLKNNAFEVIVVDDDSPDNTWEAAERLKKQYPMLRVIRRVGRRGLASAVVEGFGAATGDVFVVMDADLQHDPVIIRDLLARIADGADIAVASRYVEGGSVGSWIRGRRLLSRMATFLARSLPPVSVSDPMSGFFAIRRTAYERVADRLRPSGFKILFEILAFLPHATVVAELPLVFEERRHGSSKLSLRVEMIFLWQMLRIALIRAQAPLFAFVCAGVLAVLLPRLEPLLPLYHNAAVRAQVSETMSGVAGEQGWLLSDMRLAVVTRDGIRIMHRRHHRGADEEACLAIRHEGHRISPCIAD